MPHAAAPVIGRISAAPGAHIRRVWSENCRAVRAETERRAAYLSPEDQIVQQGGRQRHAARRDLHDVAQYILTQLK